jgi:hypothetical protein
MIQHISSTLSCVSCQRDFNFDAGETAIVLRHVAYGYGFVHAGACETAALEQIFVEPGYDSAAYAHDTQRAKLVGIRAADGWSAVLPARPEQMLAGSPFRFEPLHVWAEVEYRDGSRQVEGVTLDADWADEPGAAMFVEAQSGRDALIAYASPNDISRPARHAQWYAIASSRNGSSMHARYGKTIEAPRRARTQTSTAAALLLAAGF